MSEVNKTLTIITAFVYIILLLLLSSGIVVFVQPLHTPHLASPSMISYDQAVTIYLRTQNPTFISAFTALEQDHLLDVALLIKKGLFALAVLIVLFIPLWLLTKKRRRAAVLLSPFLFLLIHIPVASSIVANFTKAFARFHEIFFPQGNYLFPANSLLIQTYPEKFFASMFLLIIGCFIVLSLALLIVYLLSKMRRRE